MQLLELFSLTMINLDGNDTYLRGPCCRVYIPPPHPLACPKIHSTIEEAALRLPYSSYNLSFRPWFLAWDRLPIGQRRLGLPSIHMSESLFKQVGNAPISPSRFHA